MKHLDLELWWDGYKKGIEELLDEVDDYEFENEILRVKKYKNTKLIVPKNYYEHSRSSANTKVIANWATRLRLVGNSFMKLFNK